MLTIAALPMLAGATLCWPDRPAAYRLRHLVPPTPPTTTPANPNFRDNRRPTWLAKWTAGGSTNGAAHGNTDWPADLDANWRANASANERTDGRATQRVRLPRTRTHPLVLIAAAAAVAALLSGPGLGLAVAIAAMTTRSRWRSRNRTRDHLNALSALADAVHALAAELRTGAHPATAAESAGIDAPEPAATVLRTIATTARLGGDIGQALHTCQPAIPNATTLLRPLSHAWSLAERHGLPLADVLTAVARDLNGQLRFARQVEARMAGPRASAAVLAGLPVLGILLGQAMHADPIHVLLAAGPGQYLLAVGVALACGGIRWTAALTTKAVLP